MNNRALRSTSSENGAITIIATREAKCLIVGRIGDVIYIASEGALLRSTLSAELTNKYIGFVIAGLFVLFEEE